MDAQCAETHIFRPFSAGFEKPSGAMTFVKQSMKFVREKPGRVAINFEIGRLLSFLRFHRGSFQLHYLLILSLWSFVNHLLPGKLH